MAKKIKSKLEFFRFELNEKEENFKTFRDFACEALYLRRPSNDTQIMNKLFDHFMSKLVTDLAKDDTLKKQIKLEKKSTVNLHLEHQPKVDVDRHIIYGVINGGRYGRNGIIGDVLDPEEANILKKSKTVLQYYYFLLYLPLEHNEGCFIIHSNSKEENITDIFRKYITRIFKADKYNMPNVKSFSPKSFQEEFRKGALIQQIEFQDNILDDTFTKAGFSKHANEFDVIIQIKPKAKDIPVGGSDKMKAFFSRYLFGRESNKQELSNFNKASVTLNNTVSNSIRKFEWNSKDADFVPVIYLDGRISKFNDDDTPDFDELNTLCQEYLQNEVLPEIRPDLFVNEHEKEKR